MVYAIADKYDIPGLRQVALEYFRARAKECNQWPPDKFRDIVKTVYETTPESDRGLRDALVQMCYKERVYLAQIELYKDTAMEVNAFCWDLLSHAHTFFLNANGKKTSLRFGSLSRDMWDRFCRRSKGERG